VAFALPSATPTHLSPAGEEVPMERAEYSEFEQYAAKVIRIKARQLIGNYGFTPDDLEDIKQDMWLDLHQRLPKYDANRAQPSTFICLVVNNRISTIIRHCTQEKRDCRREAFSLDESIKDAAGADVPRGHTINQEDVDFRTGRISRPELERFELELDLSTLLAALPDDLMKLAELLMDKPIAVVARELGISRSTLYDKGIAPLRKLFKDKGLDEYL
jgi:RNA polymerase sigma factor (sigma-70 family)